MKADLTPEFWLKYNEMCVRLGVNPEHLAAVIQSESGWNSAAYNKDGPAGGLIQWMQISCPKGLTPATICMLPAIQQLPHIEAYYTPYKRYLKTAAFCYVVNFLPATISKVWDFVANTQDYLFGGKDMPGYAGLIFKYNPGLDVNKDKFITYKDLVLRLDQVAASSAFQQIKDAIAGKPSAFEVRDTKALQIALNALGQLPALATDGILGPKTKAALKAFQAKHSLVVDGIPGPKTWGAIAVALQPSRPTG